MATAAPVVQPAVPPAPVQGNANQGTANGGGKGGKKKGFGKKGGNAGNPQKTGGSSITDTMRSVSGGASILFTPEHTFYLVNVAAFVVFAVRFDQQMQSLSRRRPGHPPGFIYASILVWALLAKLARVGLATSQIALPAPTIPDASWVKLPPVVAGVVNSFGEFIDTTNHVTVAPRVTHDLLLYLFKLSVFLRSGGAVSAAAAAVQNHRAYLSTCYGVGARVQAMMATFVDIINAPVRFQSGSVGVPDLRAAGARYLTSAAVFLNGGVPGTFVNGVNVANLFGLDVDTWGQPGDNGVAQMNAVLANPAPFVAAHQQVVAEFTNAANPFGAGFNALVAHFPDNGTSTVFSARGDIQWLASVYDLVELDFSRQGTPSPAVVTEQSGTGFSCSCNSGCMTVQDAIVGALIQNDVVYWVDPGGIMFTIHGLNQTVRCHTTPFTTSTTALLARAFMDGVRSGSY